MTLRPIGRPPIYNFANLRKGAAMTIPARSYRDKRRIQFAASKHGRRHGVWLSARQVKGGVQVARVR